jgi:hypothetical protein
MRGEQSANFSSLVQYKSETISCHTLNAKYLCAEECKAELNLCLLEFTFRDPWLRFLAKRERERLFYYMEIFKEVSCSAGGAYYKRQIFWLLDLTLFVEGWRDGINFCKLKEMPSQKFICENKFFNRFDKKFLGCNIQWAKEIQTKGKK